MTTIPFWNFSDELLVWGANILLQVTLVTAITLAIAVIVRRSPAVRYWVLCSSLFLVLLSPAITLVMQLSGKSLISVSLMQETLVPASDTPARDSSVESPSSEIIPSTQASEEIANPPIPISDITENPLAPLAEPIPEIDITENLLAPLPEPTVLQENEALTSVAPQSTTTWIGKTLRFAMPPILFVWLTVAFFLLIRLAIGWCRLATILRSARPNRSDSLAESFIQVQRLLQLPRLPELVLSKQILTPIATGMFRPRVVLPEQVIDQVTPQQLRDILVHEVAHIMRRDQVVVLLQNLASAIFWFHPLTKMLNHRLAQAREEVCDNYVLAATDAPSYSRTLLTLAELVQTTRPLPGTVGLFTSHWKLERRVAGLLDERRSRMTRLTMGGKTFVIALSLVMAIVTALGTMTLAVEQIDETESTTNEQGRTSEATNSNNLEQDTTDAAPKPIDDKATEKASKTTPNDKVTISGNFTKEEAEKLARELRGTDKNIEGEKQEKAPTADAKPLQKNDDLDDYRDDEGNGPVPENRIEPTRNRIVAIGKESVDELFANLADEWPVRLPSITSGTASYYVQSEIGMTIANRRVLRLREILAGNTKKSIETRCLQELEKARQTFELFTLQILQKYDEADDPETVTVDPDAPDPLVVKSGVLGNMFLVAEFCGAKQVAHQFQKIEEFAKRMDRRLELSGKYPYLTKEMFPKFILPDSKFMLTILAYSVEHDKNLPKNQKARFSDRLKRLVASGVIRADKIPHRIVKWNNYPAWFDIPRVPMSHQAPGYLGSTKLMRYRFVNDHDRKLTQKHLAELASIIGVKETIAPADVQPGKKDSTPPSNQNRNKEKTSGEINTARFAIAASRLLMAGFNLTAEEVKSLEKTIENNPQDIISRTKLLAYYSRKQYKDRSARRAKRRHVLWLIQNAPESDILANSEARLDAYLDLVAYLQGKKAWLDQLKKEPENLTLLQHASNYFLHHNRKLAIESLQKAISLDKDNPKWHQSLGHLYSLDRMSTLSLKVKKETAAKSLEHYEIAYNLSSEQGQNTLLHYLAKVALAADQPTKAKKYAEEMLSGNSSNGQYGLHLHHGNITLGIISLSLDNVEQAKKHLLEAGKTPGSPTLGSFGPNMSLAKDLLHRGEKAAVLQYFELCSKFWKMGKPQLKKWSAVVKRGGTPDFGASLNY